MLLFFYQIILQGSGTINPLPYLLKSKKSKKFEKALDIYAHIWYNVYSEIKTKQTSKDIKSKGGKSNGKPKV